MSVSHPTSVSCIKLNISLKYFPSSIISHCPLEGGQPVFNHSKIEIAFEENQIHLTSWKYAKIFFTTLNIGKKYNEIHEKLFNICFSIDSQ